jgi:hypothetical protein
MSTIRTFLGSKNVRPGVAPRHGPRGAAGRLGLLLSALLLLLIPSLARAGILAGPVANAANAHLYYLLTQSTWTAAQTEARALGGDLVTINDAAENQWVFNTFSSFGGINRLLWIGLNDLGSAGNFHWTSDQPVTYLNWSPVEPNNLGAEHYVLMYPNGAPVDGWKRYPGTWNNLRDWTSDVGMPCHGVVEVRPSFWVGRTGNWSDPTMWNPGVPSGTSTIFLPAGSVVYVDRADAQLGSLTLLPGSTMLVVSGAVLSGNQLIVNHGTLIDAGNLILANHNLGNIALVQRGFLIITNGGTLRGDPDFVQADGATTVGGTFDWTDGTVRVEGGTLEVQHQGVMNCFAGNSPGPAYLQTGGRAIIDGTFSTSGATLQGGTLQGNGTLAGDLVADGGVLSPGSSPGTLTIATNFTQNAGNTLLIQLAGRGAGQSDQLSVGGVAQLGGALTVALLDGFAPVPGDQFPILVSGQRNGMFATLDVPAGIDVNYTPTSAVLVVTGTVPAHLTSPALSGDNFQFSFGTVAGRSYTVEHTEDLASTNWVFHTNLTGNGSLMQVVAPASATARRFFRVRQP